MSPQRLERCPRCKYPVLPIALDSFSGLCPSCDLAILEAQIQKGRAARDEGIARAENAASDDDRARIDAAIRAVAKRGRVFSSNDVRPLVPGVPGPLMGARFLAASKAGLIEKCGYEPSTDAKTHAHPVAQWRLRVA